MPPVVCYLPVKCYLPAVCYLTLMCYLPEVANYLSYAVVLPWECYLPVVCYLPRGSKLPSPKVCPTYTVLYELWNAEGCCGKISVLTPGPDPSPQPTYYLQVEHPPPHPPPPPLSTPVEERRQTTVIFNRRAGRNGQPGWKACQQKDWYGQADSQVGRQASRETGMSRQTVR